MRSGKVAVFGVPTAAGASRAGVERAPLVIREAGLLHRLKEQGLTVVNLSDLSLFPFREDPDHPRARNTEVVACAVRATGDEMTRALQEGFTVVLGGDCTIVTGLVAGARLALGEPVGLVYLDANADLNTPETSPSGNLWGMPLRIAVDSGDVRAADVALVGVRSLDPGETAFLGETGIADDVNRALDGADAVYVALDIDVLDPAAAASFMPEPAGLTVEQVERVLRDVRDRLPVAGVGLTGHVPETETALLTRFAATLGL
jgi:arginase